ncbi:MAG TPA: sulfatase [Planctomycetota bacterium]|nr:sulfatase [Planctomycetota bacterium]
MDVRARKLTTLALAATCFLAAAQCSGPTPRKPNVVFIVIDTLRPDHLGCYGSARATSPNLDAWAGDAVVFDRAMSAAPWTAPSLLSLMTSLYPSVHGVAHFPSPGQMSERVTTLAEVLKQQGYATGAFTEGGYAKKQFGLGQGFDVYPADPGDTTDDPSPKYEEASRVAATVERSLRWLDDVVDEAPFFLFFHTYEVHEPNRPPASDVRRFRPEYDEEGEAADHARVIEFLQAKGELDARESRLVYEHLVYCPNMRDERLAGLREKLSKSDLVSLRAERTQFSRDLYDAEILYTDRELQPLLARLGVEALRENTIVVIVSDHGEGFGEHNALGHGRVLHDEALRVVLMLRAPGVAARRVGDVVRTIDVMPTVLDLAGIGLADLKLQGRSLVPLAKGLPLESAPSFSHGLSHHSFENQLWSVREGNWRFVWDERARAGKVFDLAADPGELHDVAADNPVIAGRLLGLLRAQRDVDSAFLEQASGPIRAGLVDAGTREDLAQLGYFEKITEHESQDAPALPPPSYVGK